MGSYSDTDGRLPFLSAADIVDAQAMNEKVAAALAEECGAPYQGILYGGFMATRDGVRLIEYNARFGDPECLNLLTLLETDFVSICRAIVDRTLVDCPVSFAAQASVCKYVVPEGYPESPRVGDAVDVAANVAAGVTLYLGSVDVRNGLLLAAGSRTLGIVGVAASIAEAEMLCEQVAAHVPGRFFHRSDIGTGAAIARRVEHMKVLRAI
jgi:phosphoribosylamine-glycine ligase